MKLRFEFEFAHTIDPAALLSSLKLEYRAASVRDVTNEVARTDVVWKDAVGNESQLKALLDGDGRIIWSDTPLDRVEQSMKSPEPNKDHQS